MANLLQFFGASPTKATRYTPIHLARLESGLWTQRAALHDISQSVAAKFYGGAPDALLAGANVEITNNLTLSRRPGCSAFSAVTYPTAPNRAFEFRLPDGSIQILIDTSTNVYLDNQNGTKTNILTKAAGAGQGYFVSVGNVCYIGDGVDLVKYTPNNPNGTLWQWQGSAPAASPAITIQASGANAASWQASTVFSTMGMLVDANGNVEQLISVNAQGGNSTQFGTTGNGQPAWNQTPGGTTTDNTITWTNKGPIVQWTANTVYNDSTTGGTLANPCIIYDATSKSCYIVTNPGGVQGTSSGTRPNFTGGFASVFHDGTVKWFCLGSKKLPPVWLPSTAYPNLGSVSNDDSVSGISEPVGLTSGLPSNQTVFWQTSGGGTSGASGTAPKFATVSGNQAFDNQLIWLCLGSATRSNSASVTAWASPNGAPFSVIKDGASNLQVCITSGTTAGGAPTFETTYGGVTVDGTAKWVCVGASLSWAANTIWNLPIAGFAPPSPTQPYGGSSIKDSNGNLEFVIISGKSGGGTPSWTTTVGAQTTDSAITWIMTGPVSTNSLIWTKSHVYAYSFKARTPTDFYVTNVPPGQLAVLGPYTGSGTGAITTASPTTTLSGGNVGAVNLISGFGSTDSQFDTIVIWRDADGGGSSNMFELTEIPAPKPIGGIAQPWSFQDYLPDVATSTFPGLNNLIPAPIGGTNNPPTAGFLPMAYHFQRIWGAVGNQAFFSGGPDVITGNPNESFYAADEFAFLSGVTRLVHTNVGLLTFLTSDIEIIAGGPQTTSFYNTTLVPGVGLSSYNALDIHGGEIYFISADGQFLSLDPSLGVSRAGFAIGDVIAGLNPANCYVTVHESGIDNAVYVGDGSTGWYRVNLHQAPSGGPVWSPKASIVGGCKMVQSVEITKGVHRLLVGGTGTNQNILMRDLSLYTDNGSTYNAQFTMGSIVLAHPGQLAILGFIEADFSITAAPTTSFLLNEISGGFTSFTSSVYDPPDLYGGATSAPTSYNPLRYYFNQTRIPAKCRHLQVKVDFGSTSTQDQIFNLTIFGAMYSER